MFLPDLLPSVVVEGVAAYPDTPVVNETDERGIVGGVRTEATTYVAEGGGRGQAPAITFKWFNLGTGKVETATAEGFDIVVTGPPVRTLEQRDWRRRAVVALAGLLALAIAQGVLSHEAVQPVLAAMIVSMLIAPLLIFILVTFIAPIADMLFRSVENQIVAETLPRTVQAVEAWDYESGEAPAEEAYRALLFDMVVAVERKLHTRLGTRLNYETTGISSLFRKTGRGVDDIGEDHGG